MKLLMPKINGVKYSKQPIIEKKKKPVRTYSCSICIAGFPRFLAAKAHEQICEAKNKHLHICKYCLTLYGDAGLLQRHMARQHGDKRWMCLQCGSRGKRYAALVFLYKHVTTWHNAHSIYYCAMCADQQHDAKSFGTFAALTGHAQAVHHLYPSTQSGVDDDDSLFDETEDLEMLEENLDELLPIVDWDDDLQFGWPMGLSKEDCIADPSKHSSFTCPICEKGCAGSLSLLNHVNKIHHSRNALSCVYCNKQHHTREALRCHLQRQHVRVRKHICEQCKRDFATADHLQKHNSSFHLNGRSFACCTCGKTFHQLCHLKQHLETDRGHVSHVCGMCDEQYFRRFDLQRHVIARHR